MYLDWLERNTGKIDAGNRNLALDMFSQENESMGNNNNYYRNRIKDIIKAKVNKIYLSPKEDINQPAFEGGLSTATNFLQPIAQHLTSRTPSVQASGISKWGQEALNTL